MKIILNKCHGKFELSKKAFDRFVEEMGFKNKYLYEMVYEKEGKGHVLIKSTDAGADTNGNYILTNQNYGEEEAVLSFLMFFWGEPKCIMKNGKLDNVRRFRTNEKLITIIEELGEEANTDISNLRVFEIPDDCDWLIDDYKGYEMLLYSESEIKRY